MLQSLKSGLSHLFFPIICEGCEKPLVEGEEILCLGCAAQMPETGFHNQPANAAAKVLAGRIPFIHATAFAHFTPDGLLQHLLHGLKYGHKKEIGSYLGRICGQSLLATDWIQEINVLIPVPLHPKKEASRGFNQSAVIATAIGQVIGQPVDTTSITRKKQTESQTKKTRTERVSNMADAFTINDGEKLWDKHILLVDDVLTTGATLEACALALMQEKSIKISVLTIGIADS